MVSPADYRRRGALSWRIRAYVAVLAFRHLGFGASLVADSDELGGSPAFRYVFEFLAPHAWGWIYLVLGVAALGGLWRPKEKGIRLLVILSVGLSSAWAAGTALAMVLAPPVPTGIAVTAFVAFAAKDLIVAGMVYVNPVEDLAKREQQAADESSSS